jgi:hypothetical protein
MQRMKLVMVGVAIVALVVAAAASAAKLKLKPFSFYGQTNKVSFQISEDGKGILPFQGYCTPVGLASPKSIGTVTPIPVNAAGKFKWSGQNSVNTPEGGTLEKTALVTIEGEFVSRTEAVGKYQIHEPGCKVIKFKAKYEAE